MPADKQDRQALLDKANSLPLCPGVYIMKDKSDRVIYVGKSRKLKNRVSQYFQNSEKCQMLSQALSKSPAAVRRKMSSPRRKSREYRRSFFISLDLQYHLTSQPRL